MSSTTNGARKSVPTDRLVETFRAHGQTYRWQEGASVVRSHAATATPRDGQGAFFVRSVVPQVESRGARGLVFHARVAAGWLEDEARWVSWRAPADEAAVWGLYVSTARLLGAGDLNRPANDAFTLVAWGDGAALAWADERASARAALRAALRRPPAWLVRGMRSKDVTFPVRIDPATGSDRAGASNESCVAVVRPASERVVAGAAGARASTDDALAILRAWRRGQGANGAGGGSE